jgi:hypothetical protein
MEKAEDLRDGLLALQRDGDKINRLALEYQQAVKT